MTLLNWLRHARQSRKSVPPARYRDAFQADLFVSRLEERRVLADPSGADATLNVLEDATITFQAADFGFTDPDGDAFDAVKISSLPSDGTLKLDGVAVAQNDLILVSDITANKLTFDPAMDASGTPYTTFSFQVQDDMAELDQSANTITINVEAVNDAPVVTAPGAALDATEQTALDIHGAGFSVTDVDAGGLDVTAMLKADVGTITVVEGDSGITIDSGNGSGTVMITGSIAEINNLLGGGGTGTITYLNNSDEPPASATFTVTVNDGGSTGTDPGLTADSSSEEGSASVTINIEGVNDAPVVTAPGMALSATEQTSLNIHGAGFSVTDADEAGSGATATLSATAGTINVVAGDSGISVDSGDGTGSVTISGTIAQIDNLLTGAGTGTITYLNSSDDPPASVTFTVTVNDTGNTGTDPLLTGDGTSEEGTANVTINIAAVNDAPVVTAPGMALNATEQTNLAIHGAGFSVSDADEGGSGATATLSVDVGTITVDAGDSGITIDSGNGTTAVMISGTIAQIDNLLTGGGTGTITYLNTSDTPPATATFTVTVNDTGNTGTDPGLTGDGTSEEGTADVTINIAAVNDAPVVTAPAMALSATEQMNLAIQGTGFSVSDVDVAAGTMLATLAVGEGMLTITEGNTGVTIDSGNGTASVVVSGTIDQINKLLTGSGTGTILYFNNSDDPAASTDLTVTVNDQGNTGTDPGTTGDGMSEEGENTVAINITAVNDPPAVGTNAGATVAEGDTVTITTAQLNENDPDDGGTGLTYTVTSAPTNGFLQLSTNLGVPITSFTQDDLDNNRVQYVHDGSETTSDSFDFSLADGGEDGTTPAAGTFNITVTPVNDAPVVTAPAMAFNVAEDENLAIQGAGFSVTDSDEAGGGANAILMVTEGDITVVVGDSGVMVVGQNGKSTVTITGTIAQINSLLTGTSTGTITYVDTKNNPNTPVTFTVTVNDEGNTGADPGLTGDANSEDGSNTATINIAEINDAPVVTAPAMALNATEQTNLAISSTGFSVTDSDADNGIVMATLTVGEGMLTIVEGNTGVTISSGNNTGTVVLTGTTAAIDKLLTGSGTGTITYFNDSDTPSASTTLTVTVNDQGNTGTDPGLTGDANSEEDSNSITINITAVNDAPLVTAPGAPLAATEQTDLAIQGTGFTVAEVDEAGGMATATLSVTQGNITVVAGDSGVTMINGNGTGIVTFDGTIAQINALLTGAGTGTITYNNPSDAPAGSVTFTVTVNDQGNVGQDPGLTGDAMSEQGTAGVTINITAVNDGPVVTAPAAPLPVNEGASLFIQGTGFSVTDADEAGSGATATLNVTEGTITVVTGNSGVSIDGGNGTGTVLLSGTIAQINSLLNGTSTGTIVYVNSVDAPAASAVFTVTVNDQGHTGIDPGLTGDGMSEEDSASVTINVTAVNDAPIVIPPVAPLAATEQTNLSIHGMGFSVVDPDEAGDGATATLSVTAGTISVSAGDSGVMVNAGNGTGLVTISGTIAQINNLLTGAGTGTIVYLNNSDTPPANVTFTVTVNDQGHNGLDPGLSGDATSEEGSASVTINITAVNDPPIVSGPGAPLNAVEQTDLNIHGTGFSTMEVDEAGGTATATLSVGEGMITVTPGDSGVMVNSGNGTGTVTISGTIAQINNLLTAAGTGTIVYVNPLDAPSASTTLTVTVNDQGNTGIDPGPGGTADDMSEEASASVTINVANVNDPPTANDVNEMITEDDFPATFNFAADDVDADDDPTTLVYTVSAPMIALPPQLNPIAGSFSVSIDQPAPGQFQILDPNGSFQQLAVGESATITFTYFATDSGMPALSSPMATVTIIVQGVNDAPQVQILQAPTTVTEGSTGHFEGRVVDVDFSDASTLTLHINWNDVDNPPSESVFVDPVTGQFSVDHFFADDFPGNTSDVAAVQFIAEDNHEGMATLDHPVTVLNLPPQFLELVASDLDANGMTTITFRVADPSLRDVPLTVIINWNDPFAEVQDQITMVTVDWVNDNGQFTRSHTYGSAPDPNDPTNIRITVSVGDDDGGNTVAERMPTIPGTGLASIPFDVTPETPTFTFELPTVVASPLSVDSTVEVVQVIDFRTGQTGPSLGANEQLVLQALTPDGKEKGEEIVLGEQDERWEAVLQRLPEIFAKSTDDHYRIYLKREDGTRRLVLNVILRRHKQIDADEVKQGESLAGDAAKKKQPPAKVAADGDPGNGNPPRHPPDNGPVNGDVPVVAPKPGKNADPPPPRPMSGAQLEPPTEPLGEPAHRRIPASAAVAAVAGWTGLEGLRRWRHQVDDEMSRWADAGFMERKRRLSRTRRTCSRFP